MKKLSGMSIGLLCFTLALRAADVPDLAQQLKSKDTDARRAAAKSLAEAGADAKPALAALVAALRDSDLFVRRYAAQAIGEIGPDAKSAVPNLTTMLRDTKEKKEAQEGAAVALGKIGTAGVSALSTALRDREKDPAVRRAIVTSLGRIGPDAKPALPTLMSELNDKEGVDKKQKSANLDSIKADVVNALGDIASAKDTNVVKALQSLADSKQNKKDKNLQTAVKDAVRKIQARK